MHRIYFVVVFTSKDYMICGKRRGRELDLLWLFSRLDMNAMNFSFLMLSNFLGISAVVSAAIETRLVSSSLKYTSRLNYPADCGPKIFPQDFNRIKFVEYTRRFDYCHLQAMEFNLLYCRKQIIEKIAYRWKQFYLIIN